MKNNLHILKKIVLVQIFVFIFSVAGFATNVEGTEKTGEKKDKSKTEKVDPKKEKPDSLRIDQKSTTGINAKNLVTRYSSEQFMEQDSLEESASVVSFNFIQYIIENFKFSEEIF